MDSTGLFGVERADDGLLHAVAGGRRSTWALTDQAAQHVVTMFLPDPEEVAAGIASGDDDFEVESRNEAWQWPNAWDTNAPGASISILTQAAIEGGFKLSMAGLKPVAAPDGMIYLVSDDRRSEVGATPEAAAAIMAGWEGITAAADLAAGHVGNDHGLVVEAVMARWDVECAATAASFARAA